MSKKRHKNKGVARVGQLLSLLAQANSIGL